MIFVGLAALLTVPWTFWVLVAAYERDVNDKIDRLAERVKNQVVSAGDWTNPRYWTGGPQQLMDPLRGELMADDTVQAVVFLDYSRNAGGYVRRSDAIPIPQSKEEAERMLHADRNSHRKMFLWQHRGKDRGIIYLDLSQGQLWRHFITHRGTLLWRVGVQTAAAFIVLSVVGIVAFRVWGTAARQKELAELEQRGMLAERGLTAAVLAHEIRNPLAALRFQLHSLRVNSQVA